MNALFGTIFFASIEVIILLLCVLLINKIKKKPLYNIYLCLIGSVIMLILSAALYWGTSKKEDSDTVSDTTPLTTTQETEAPVPTTAPLESTEPNYDTAIEPTTSANRNTKYNPLLNGRGIADIGTEEPDYINLVGYAAVYEGYAIDDVPVNEWKWSIPTYEKDKQFWNETGSIEHKTQLLVKEQLLEPGFRRYYRGYLLVERLDTKEECYINVKDFVTNPYWTIDDPYEAAKLGNYIAEFKQASDYYPVNQKGKKAALEDGTLVLINGATGMYGSGGPDYQTNQLEGYVLTGSEKGLHIFINMEDLSITY